MKITKFKIGKTEGLFIPIPYIYKNFKLVQYATAGTYIMETDSTGLNNWKINIPRGNYEIIGRSNELAPELVEEKFEVPFKEYIKLLNEKDITVNYSDHSDFLLVVILTERNETMKLDIEIFDKDGKTLHIGSVISRFLFKQAEKFDMDVNDLVIGLETVHPIRDDGCNLLQLMDGNFKLIDELLSENGL